MKTVAATIGQTLLLLVLGTAVGLAVNTVRGKDKISLQRDYFPPAPAAPTNPDNPGATETEPAAKSEFGELTFDEALALFDDPKAETGEYVFVDARADGPFQKGHIPGAVQCDYYRSEDYLPSVLDRVQNAEKVIVYCNGGDCEDSLLLCREFVNYTVPLDRIYLFRGGWEAWQQAGAPVEKDER
jgi:rhodanese-related sulfurtransferase